VDDGDGETWDQLCDAGRRVHLCALQQQHNVDCVDGKSRIKQCLSLLQVFKKLCNRCFTQPSSSFTGFLLYVCCLL